MHLVKFLSRGRGGGLWWPASCLSRTSKDEADVKSLVEHFERFGIFSVCRSKVAALDEVTTEEASGHLLSLTTNDVAT